MSYQSVNKAASDLKEVNDKIDELQAKKDRLQTEMAKVNSDLTALKTERDQKAAKLKTEVGTI